VDQLSGIRVFVRVTELGSFSKAAKDLSVSQSTITKHLAWLEGYLGARLLNRNTRGVSLTEDGLTYYESGKAIIHSVENADCRVGIRSSEVAGTLRISTSAAFGRRILSPMLIEFLRENPKLDVDLNCDDAFVDLVSQGVDVALRMGRLQNSCLGSRLLGKNPWVMVASSGYLARRSTPSCPGELTNHDCIIYSSVQGDAVWQLAPKHGSVENVLVKGRLRSNNLSTLLSVTESGLGISILPRYVAASSLRKGSVVEVLSGYSVPEQELRAIFVSPKLVSNKVRRLIDFLSPRFRGEWWDNAGHSVRE
jgi:DNA-binding transcriptional LysR family regulator